MGDSLIIVESPAKAKTILKILGPGYIIKASMGHIRDLPIHDFGIDVKNDFEPEYVIMKGRSKVVQDLKKTSKEAEKVYLAPDPDREGEAIAWHLSEILKHKKIYRVKFNEITKDAVLEAFSKPGEIDMKKVDSQQTRRILDRIVGYKISPLLWKSISKGLSAGRVQSVAVLLVCDRDREIENFISQEYWSLWANLTKFNSEVLFKAKLEKIDGKPVELKKQDEVDQIIQEAKTGEFIISDINKKDKFVWSPPPFITSQLQQGASTKLRFSVQKTMQIAQQLYEGIEIGEEGIIGLITYMRTDSFRIADTAKSACRNYIENKFGKDYLLGKDRVFKAKKGAQEAHEAIRPTYIDKEPDKIKEFLSDDQYRLYKLIWERFLASQMAPAKMQITTVDINVLKYLFVCKGRIVLFDGFMKIEKNNAQENTEKEEGSEDAQEDLFIDIPELNINEKLNLKELEPKQHFTKPPARYTEASLVRALEEKEIGRPSTYAPIIQTILKREYVEKQKGKLFSTDLGRRVTDLLVKNFPDIINVEFTASMEKDLDLIEEGSQDWKNVLKKFYSSFITELEKASVNIKSEKKPAEITSEICDKCGAHLVIRKGKYGEFLACSAFPKCRNIKNMEKKPAARETGIKCPEEGCAGLLVERRSRKGKSFYGCSAYPKCKYTQNIAAVKRMIEGKEVLIENEDLDENDPLQDNQDNIV